MDTTTLGLFRNQKDVENAINELGENGFSSKDISIVMKDQGVAKVLAKNTGTNVAGGLATGVATGGVLGGVAGLLVGIGAIIIPGLGGVLIAGPIAVALGLTGATASTVTGALTGALAGGLLGGLIGLGLPEQEARIYETDIKQGAILLGIPTTSPSENIVKKVLEDNHATQIHSVMRNIEKL